MQPLIYTTTLLFNQIKEALATLSPLQYTHQHSLIQCSSIGQHLRHIIEMYQEMLKAYETGCINYELRQRNYQIETDADFAIAQMHQIIANMKPQDAEVLLFTKYQADQEPIITKTTIARETIYNIEHTIHHMAIMRIAAKATFNIDLEETFGVAPSTIQYKQQCAQLA
jgi:hypothetical protein